MNRIDYLRDVDVAGFIQWLRRVVVTEHGFTQSFKTKNGRGSDVELIGFQSALRAYEFENRQIAETQILLNRLSETIQQEIQEENANPDASQQHDLLVACLETLVWGGVTVRATIRWLAENAQQGTLHEVIRRGSRALADECISEIEQFRHPSDLRSDSAATKIYALANENSIIYDNRVGAALAKLVCQYLDQSCIDDLPESLSFMVKRSNSGRRDPSDINRTFTRKNTGYAHAFWNQRANWIINELVSYDDVDQTMAIVDGLGSLRAIEAALFVMGDDVRNLSVNPALEVVQNVEGQQCAASCFEFLPELVNGVRFQSYCVPSTHDFSVSIDLLHQFRQQNPECFDTVPLRDFINLTRGGTLNTANAYRSPLMPAHFNLVNATDELVCCLAEEPLSDRAFDWLQQSWQERPLQRIMICTWAVGILLDRDVINPNEQCNVLINRNLAGTPDSAMAIVRVGRYFGNYFGLLGPNGPTDRFWHLFD